MLRGESIGSALTSARHSAIGHSSDFHRAVFEHAMDGVLLTAPDGQIFAANPSACRLLGRTEAQICTAGRDGVVDPSSPQLQQFLIERRRHGSARGELVLVRGDGARFPAEVSSEQFLDASGELRTILMFRDISRAKASEQALSESQALLSAIVNSTDDLVWSVDPGDFSLQWCNDAFRDHFARHRSIRVEPGMRLEDIITDRGIIDRWQSYFRTALRQQSFSIEYSALFGNRFLLLNMHTIRRGVERSASRYLARTSPIASRPSRSCAKARGGTVRW